MSKLKNNGMENTKMCKKIFYGLRFDVDMHKSARLKELGPLKCSVKGPNIVTAAQVRNTPSDSIGPLGPQIGKPA